MSGPAWAGFDDPGDRPEGWRPPNADKTLPPTLIDATHVKALMETCGGGPANARDLALIAVLFRTGILPMEAVSLRVADVQDDPPRLRVAYGKKLADRTLALDDFAWRFMRPWLSARAELPGDHLFCVANGSRRGKKWNEGGVRSMIRRRAAKAGISPEDERIHPSAFRFSLAAELMIEQWPIPYIMALMGTRTLQSMQDIFGHLKIEPPPDNDIMEIARARPPVVILDAP